MLTVQPGRPARAAGRLDRRRFWRAWIAALLAPVAFLGATGAYGHVRVPAQPVLALVPPVQPGPALRLWLSEHGEAGD